MPLTRREFVHAGVGAAAGLSIAARARGAQSPAPARFRAVAFDALAIFDPGPIAALASELAPERAAQLMTEWRTRQFEYTWLRVAAGRYADFWQVTQDALRFAIRKTGVQLSPQARDRLMDAHLELRPWPDVAPALAELKRATLRLALLSNFTPRMLDACVRRSGLSDLFDHALSTDLARTFKPDPRAYRLAPDTLALKPAQILFVAFAGWDAFGAKAFGLPTFWANRLKLPAEELGETADATGDDLSTLPRFAIGEAPPTP